MTTAVRPERRHTARVSRPAAARPRSGGGASRPTTRVTVHPTRAVSLRATLLVSSVLFFTVLGGAVGIQAQRIENQHRLDQIELELIEQQELNRQLRADVAVAESPGRIMAAARELGMVEPGPVLPLISPGVSVPQAQASTAGGPTS